MYCLIAAAVCAAGLQAGEATEPPKLVIRGGSVFDVVSGTMQPDRMLVIEGERILAIATAQQPAPIPQGATIIDARGKYVIPGFIDAHVHLVHLADRTHVTGDEFLPLFLANGVTAVRSAGDAIVAEAGVAHFAATHAQQCPRVFLASPLIDAEPPFHRDVGVSLTDPAKVAAFVDDMAAWNVTTLKIYVGTTRDVAREVIHQGHRQGMKVAAHLGAYAAQDAVLDGVDCLEHISSVFNYSIPPEVQNQPHHRPNLDLSNPRCQALVAALAKHQVAVDPTLVVFRNMIYLNDLEEIHHHPDLAYVPRRMRQYWDAYRAGSNLARETRAMRHREIRKYQELTGILHRSGVMLLAGTDAPEPYVAPGFSLHKELELLVESGLSPADALRSATLNNARMLNQSDHLGRVAVGMLADLVILAANPLEDIRNTRKIERVIRGGIVCDPEALLQSVAQD